MIDLGLLKADPPIEWFQPHKRDTYGFGQTVDYLFEKLSIIYGNWVFDLLKHLLRVPVGQHGRVWMQTVDGHA